MHTYTYHWSIHNWCVVFMCKLWYWSILYNGETEQVSSFTINSPGKLPHLPAPSLPNQTAHHLCTPFCHKGLETTFSGSCSRVSQRNLTVWRSEDTWPILLQRAIHEKLFISESTCSSSAPNITKPPPPPTHPLPPLDTPHPLTVTLNLNFDLTRTQLHTSMKSGHLSSLKSEPICYNNTHAYGPGKFSHKTSIGVDLFVSPIFWYLSLSVSAFKPCQGKLPLRKYMNMCPRASKSSLLLCSTGQTDRHNTPMLQHSNMTMG